MSYEILDIQKRVYLEKYATFEGKADRRELWLAAPLMLFAACLGPLIILVLCPSIAVSVRRMHDLGKSGWSVLWQSIIGAVLLIASCVIPFVVLGYCAYLIYLIVLYSRIGIAGANQVGGDSHTQTTEVAENRQ